MVLMNDAALARAHLVCQPSALLFEHSGMKFKRLDDLQITCKIDNVVKQPS